jgi:hypothetical protein
VNETMLFTSHDIDVIERALRIAISHEKDRAVSEEMREVLSKLREKAAEALNWEQSVHTGTWLHGYGDD